MPVRFLVKFVVTCAINSAGKLICLRDCLHEHDCMGLIDKPGYIWFMLPQGANVTVKQPSHLNNFIMRNLSLKPLN